MATNSYTKIMRQIEKAIDKYNKQAEYSAVKDVKSTSSSLMARTSLPAGIQFNPDKGQESTITDEIASYIMSIRKQKEELIRGKE